MVGGFQKKRGLDDDPAALGAKLRMVLLTLLVGKTELTVRAGQRRLVQFARRTRVSRARSLGQSGNTHADRSGKGSTRRLTLLLVVEVYPC